MSVSGLAGYVLARAYVLFVLCVSLCAVCAAGAEDATAARLRQ